MHDRTGVAAPFSMPLTQTTLAKHQLALMLQEAGINVAESAYAALDAGVLKALLNNTYFISKLIMLGLPFETFHKLPIEMAVDLCNAAELIFYIYNEEQISLSWFKTRVSAFVSSEELKQELTLLTSLADSHAKRKEAGFDSDADSDFDDADEDEFYFNHDEISELSNTTDSGVDEHTNSVFNHSLVLFAGAGRASSGEDRSDTPSSIADYPHVVYAPLQRQV
jgi:hypothetical protein